MEKNNSEIIEKLKLILKSMERLRESFRLEKEKVLEHPGFAELEKLRERSRFIYQMKVAEYLRDTKKLKIRIAHNQSQMEEAEDLAELCRDEAMQLQAHFVSTPNRLIRVYRAENPFD